MRPQCPKSRNILHSVFTAFKVTIFYILFVITAAGVVPWGGRKKSPCTSSIVQIISHIRSFEIIGNIFKSQYKILYLGQYSRLHFGIVDVFVIDWPD